ncbi:Kinesin-16 [Aduncisulcus paluster]|uniref:Kinesin-like protein n=1 Tax=Aduncisulcus paluster TaxID=2918883 RepID=A0ABQ5KTQ7_9EUKA|nr:Kinesin-16 [Aduncisulcus paluster]
MNKVFLVRYKIEAGLCNKSGMARGEDKKKDTNNITVVVRVRPPIRHEIDKGDYQSVVRIGDDNRTITICENPKALASGDPAELSLFLTHNYTFDYVYGPKSTQSDVYSNTARQAVQSTLEGYNATVLAYGQTSSGKTFTMEGYQGEKRGIIPRSVEEVFQFIESSSEKRRKFLVRASYLQIYKEIVSDLLKPERTSLHIRYDKTKGTFVEGLSEWVVRSPQEVYSLIEKGVSTRATGSTWKNPDSSRSHAVFMLICEQSEIISQEADDGTIKETEVFKIGKLNLVDLAGSERVKETGVSGERSQETKYINLSLFTLCFVITQLVEGNGNHVSYRDSKLTRLLEDSLGGNCKTYFMAMVSPAMINYQETLGTLKYANNAKKIKNHAKINEDLDKEALLRKYERELKQLRKQLATKSQHVVDKRRLLEMEEQRKRAEQDRLAAIKALEQRSREFLREKQEKRKLEERIAMMQSQMLLGGRTIMDTSEFKSAVAQEHARIQQKFQQRMYELEKERHSLQEDMAQVDKYKELLVKQRDIMTALTNKLAERDESIAALEEELLAYDKHQELLDTADEKICELEDALKVKEEENDDVYDRLDRTEKEKNELEELLRDKLPLMVNKEIEKRIKLLKERVEDEDAERMLVLLDRKLDSFADEEEKDDQGLDEEEEEPRLSSDGKDLASLDSDDADEKEKGALHSSDLFDKDRPTPTLQDKIKQQMNDMVASEEYDKLKEEFTKYKEEKEREIEHLKLLRSESDIHKTYDKRMGEFMGTKRRVDDLEKKVRNSTKEKEALLTIFEKKIKVMVDNLVDLLSSPSDSQVALYQSHSLQRLVSVSITALKNSTNGP